MEEVRRASQIGKDVDYEYAVFFAQVSCKSIDEDFFMKKNYLGALISCLGLYMCLIFWMRINRIWNEVKIEDKILDYQLTTLDDYSVCGNISREFYQDVINQTKIDIDSQEDQTDEQKRDIVPIQRFTNYFIEETQK